MVKCKWPMAQVPSRLSNNSPTYTNVALRLRRRLCFVRVPLRGGHGVLLLLLCVGRHLWLACGSRLLELPAGVKTLLCG